MDRRENSRAPRRAAGAHAQRPTRPRREPLRDNYYYEEPPRRGSQAPPDTFEDISSYSPGRKRQDIRPSPKRGRPAPQNRRAPRNQQEYYRPSRVGRAVKTVLLLFFLLIVAGGVYVFGFMLSGLTVTEIDKSNLGLSPDAYTDSQVKNIALFGLDAREDENTGRSDALMVLTVDSRRHKLKLTSILRDSQVYIDGYGYDKITHAYAYGGPELAINTLNQNYHLDIENYVTVNFVEMAQIVDAFGGVRLTITYPELEQINENLVMLSLESNDANIKDTDYLKPDNFGENILLNGNQAVAYARIRHLEGGDDVRAGRQQLVLQGLIQQLKGKSKLTYPFIVQKVAPLCETSMGYLDMMGLAPFMLTGFTMESLTIPGEEEGAYGDYNENGAWVYLYDTEAAAGHISRFIYEEDSPYA